MAGLAQRVREYDVASKAAILSVVSNAGLMAVKLAFALLFGSVALLGDGVDSAEDLLASALVFITVRMALQPADEEHPYGHGKAESLAALSQAGLIAGGAVFITVAALRRFFGEDHEIYVGPSLIAVGVTATVNLLVAGYAFRAARISGSVAVASDAKHLLTNVVQALAVGAALVLVGVTGNHVFDPIVALLLAVYLVWIAIGILRAALSELLDTSLPEATLEAIQGCLDTARPGLRGYHALRSRKSGRETHIDMHVLVDPEMSVSEAHLLSEAIETDLCGHVEGAAVTIHIDPDEPDIMERDARTAGAAAQGLHLHRH
ncbi:MAG TPA: cation diffusion facilitator family transporter [Dehalococcoidia bacterium]|nr:cation diffusion facilitator family transporter [Dehalococcoidia bacterium]